MIQQLEAKKHGLFELMASPVFYTKRGDSMVETRQQLAEVEAAIQKAYTRWMELETLAAAGEE